MTSASRVDVVDTRASLSHRPASGFLRVLSQHACVLCISLAAWLLVTSPTTGKPQASLQFHGQVLDTNGRLLRGPLPVVFLHGGTLPYNNQKRVGMDGSFKFEKLLPGAYVLIIAVPGEGEMRQTIDIGPTLADKKGIIHETFRFTGAPSPDRVAVVQKSQLSIPRKAQEEVQRSLQALSRNDVEGAKKCLQAALDLAPHYSEAWNQLGVIAYQTGDYPAAEKHFRRALEEFPEAYWALVNLGGALLAVGKDAEALEVNQRAVKRAPDDALAQSQLGKNYFRVGDLTKAETHLKQAKALDPRHFSSPQLTLADVYYLQNRDEERITELKEYLKYHPDGYFAERVRTLLENAEGKKGEH